jgi:hypothetical protein
MEVMQAKLEERLQSFNPDGKTNITKEELRSSLIRYDEGVSIGLVGEDVRDNPLEQLYFFFPRQENSLNIPLSNQKEMYLALQPDTYGFSDDRMVSINPTPLNLDLSQRAREVYDNILASPEMKINTLLEAVGFIVNHSLDYDFDKQRELDRKWGGDASRWDELQKNYRSTGKEVLKGDCQDAGAMIRDILGSLGMEDNLKYTKVIARDGPFFHDTTMIFDKDTGEWAVINSKSPSKQYNLVSKEKLHELGSPFYRVSKKAE